MTISSWAQDACVVIAAIGSAAAVVIGALNARSLRINTETTEDTHRMVNGDHSTVLRLAARALRKVADNSQLPEDMQAAREAEEMSTSHDNRTAKKWTKLP